MLGTALRMATGGAFATLTTIAVASALMLSLSSFTLTVAFNKVAVET